jgi:sigma-E factor negative regulatory protein RseA
MVMGNFKAGSGAIGAGGPTVPTPEEISLLIDGELEPERAGVLITSLCRSEGVATWVCYHLIGDAVRGISALSPTSASKCVDRLAAEPIVLAPLRRSPAPHAIALALAATIAAVSVVGWVALTTMPAPGAVIASARQAVGVRAVSASEPDARP